MQLFARAALGLVLTLCSSASAQQPVTQGSSASEEPNFLLIVADDLGFSDLGCFGGEIATPNLDRLAREGRRFTNLYVSLSCSPTRAMLLSGLDNHMTGLGNMYERTAPNQEGKAGYEGVLRSQVPTIAEALRDAGYHTYMTGKWHLGHAPTHLPSARGFERTFSLLNSAGSHFDTTGYKIENEESEFTADGEYLEKLPRNYYSTRTFTEKMLRFIDENVGDGRPFFAYLAYQAPHDPLQVPDKWLRRYKAQYDDGWDVMREQRLERMKQLGILPPGATMAPRLWYIPAFDDLTGIAQVQAARKMEIYAAMVEFLDDQVGRILDYLEETGELERTYIFFLSDNGPEGNDSVSTAKKRPASAAANFLAQNYRTDFESWGRKDAYLAYGQAWAQVSATPFSMFKGSMFEGGIRSPLIVWGTGGNGDIDRESVLHISDIAPTLLDLAGVPESRLYGMLESGVQTGKSLRPMLERSTPLERQGFGMEMWGARVYREGRFKITWMHRPFGIDDWQLFDVNADPAESRDLSAEQPELKARLIEAWELYAQNNGVILPNRTDYDGLEDTLPPRPPVDVPDWPRGQETNWTSSQDEDDEPAASGGEK